MNTRAPIPLAALFFVVLATGGCGDDSATSRANVATGCPGGASAHPSGSASNPSAGPKTLSFDDLPTAITDAVSRTNKGVALDSADRWNATQATAWMHDAEIQVSLQGAAVGKEPETRHFSCHYHGSKIYCHKSKAPDHPL